MAAIAQLGFIEFAIVAGEGGAGTLFIADLEIRDLTPARPPSARASSAQPGFGAGGRADGSRLEARERRSEALDRVDCTAPRMLGGLIIDWLEQAPANGFRVRASLGGKRWKTVYTAAHAGGKRSYVYLPGLSTRFIRLELDPPCAGASLRLEPFEFSRSIEAFWYAVAAAEARGWHPRWLHREQSEWTPIGTSHGTECALMNTDGMVEVRKASFSLEPMLLVAGRLFTWADVEAQQALADGWMPVPTVDLGRARLAPVDRRGGHRERYVAHPLSTAEPLAERHDGTSVRVGAPLPSHPAVAELSRRGRREPRAASRLGPREPACRRAHLDRRRRARRPASAR